MVYTEVLNLTLLMKLEMYATRTDAPLFFCWHLSQFMKFSTYEYKNYSNINNKLVVMILSKWMIINQRMFSLHSSFIAVSSQREGNTLFKFSCNFLFSFQVCNVFQRPTFLCTISNVILNAGELRFESFLNSFLCIFSALIAKRRINVIWQA